MTDPSEDLPGTRRELLYERGPTLQQIRDERGPRLWEIETELRRKPNWVMAEDTA
jgi:hypothetical protein